jgi:Rps23 Pro-64 3,4-dihydroxylase Tpa1-like proline 4-hydroxylase
VQPFFEPEFAEQLHAEFPPNDQLPKRYSEKGVLQDLGLFLDPDNARRFGPATARLLAFVRSAEFAAFIAGLSGQHVDHDITQISFNSYVPYQGLDSHIDHTRGTTGFVRPLTMVVHLSRDWRPEWGGRFLLSREPALDHPIVSADPAFNVGMLWERTPDAWHGVTRIETERARRTIALTLQRRDAISYAYGIRRSALGRALERSGLGRALKKRVKRALKG